MHRFPSVPTGRASFGLRVLALLLLAASVPPAFAEDPPSPATEAPEAPAAAPAPQPAVPAESGEPPLAFPDEGVITKDDGTVVYFYRTNFVPPAQLKNALEKLVQVPGVAFREFPEQNTLLIEGDEDAVALALDTASYFDVSAPQVFIEAKVIEITYDSNFEFGLGYLWSREQTGPNTLFRGAEGVLNPQSFLASTLPGGLPFQGTSVLFGFAGKNAEKYGLADLTLQALQIDGKAEILSKPSIIATQGIAATVTTSESRQISAFLRADQNNSFYQAANIDTGVKLDVMVSHVGESFVTLEVIPEVKGFQSTSAAIGGSLKPVTTTRSAKTTVTMGDGETLVIGGLYTNATVEDKGRTPLLSEIPLLGHLFTRTRNAEVKTEVVFMLTPVIVQKTSDLRVITPPAELERLEGLDEGGSPTTCEPCFPNGFPPLSPKPKEPAPPLGPFDAPPRVSR